jgi:uncharacterized protein (TIRG00374 family)
MNEDEKPIVTTKAFSRWKVMLALVVGISISSIVLYRSFSAIEFKSVSEGTGTHDWKDSNHNGKIDWNNRSEFVRAANGNYRAETAGSILKNIHWSSQTFFWLFLAILAMIVRDLAYVWRIRILTKRELSFKKSLNVILLWEYASALAPGVVSGASVAMFLLNKEKINLGKSTAIVLITALFDNLFYVLFIPVLLLFFASPALFPTSVASSTTTTSLFWFGYVIFSSLCLFLFLSILGFPSLLKTVLTTVTKFFLFKRFQVRATKIGEDIRQTSITMKQEPFSFWGTSFLATILSWSARFLVINFVAQAFISMSFMQHKLLFIKQFVIWMFLRISPTPGGSGVAEWAFGELLADFSSQFILLGSMAILWRLISYYPYLIIGAVLLPRWLKRTTVK